MLQNPINMKNDIMTIRVFLLIITIFKNVEFEDRTGRSLTVVGYWWVKAKNLGIVKWNVKSGEVKIKPTSKLCSLICHCQYLCFHSTQYITVYIIKMVILNYILFLSVRLQTSELIFLTTVPSTISTSDRCSIIHC